MDRRWIAWALGTGLIALIAFAPFRDSSGDVDTQGTLDPGLGAPGITGSDSPAGPSPSPAGGSSTAGGSVGAGGAVVAPVAGDGGDGQAVAPDPAVPDLPAPTERELAILGPLIAAMDTGQRAGTPLVLGIATSLVASGLPGEDSVPPEAQPVLAALAELISTPGAQVNDITTQNSVYLAQLDRALGELAFANPALNASIHQTAELLATMGRAAEPVSPPGAVSLADLSILLTYFVVE